MNGKGAKGRIMNQIATVQMAQQFSTIIIKAGKTLDKSVIDVQDHDCWDMQKINGVPLV